MRPSGCKPAFWPPAAIGDRLMPRGISAIGLTIGCFAPDFGFADKIRSLDRMARKYRKKENPDEVQRRLPHLLQQG